MKKTINFQASVSMSDDMTDEECLAMVKALLSMTKARSSFKVSDVVMTGQPKVLLTLCDGEIRYASDVPIDLIKFDVDAFKDEDEKEEMADMAVADSHVALARELDVPIQADFCTMQDQRSPMAELHITEHKSESAIEAQRRDNMCRVFVNGDVHYGYFVSEIYLLKLLNNTQKRDYFSHSNPTIQVARTVAQLVIDNGHTPYDKVKLA